MPSSDEIPLFYPTIHVGALSDQETDDVRIDVDVRAYAPLQPGDPVALAEGESLTLNGHPLSASGTGHYHAEHLPIAPDDLYAIEWVRPSGTIGFNPISIPHLSLSVPGTIEAGVPFPISTTPAVDGLELHSSNGCAEPKPSGGFEGGPSGNVLHLLQQPCTTDLGVTHTTNWDVAFVDPKSLSVIGRGHVSLIALTSAWQQVNVVASQAQMGCDLQAPFGAPVPDGEDTSVNYVMPTRFSADERVAYASVGPIGTAADIYQATRMSTADPFGAPAAIAPLNGDSEDRNPSVTADGLTMVFESYRLMYPHIYTATRASAADTWSNIQLLSEVDYPAAIHYDMEPFISADGEELWFTSDRPDGTQYGYLLELWFSVRQNGTFGPPQRAAQLNTENNEGYPVLSADRLTLYFASDRGVPSMPGGGWKIFRATRANVNDPFGAPEQVNEIMSTPYIEYMPGFVSADGCRLYLQSMHGNYITQNLVATRP